MFFFNRRKPETVRLPGDVGSFVVPEWMSHQSAGDDALLLYPKDDSVLGLRLTCTPVKPDAGEKDYDLAAKHVRGLAREKGLELVLFGDHVAIRYETESGSEAEKTVTHHWFTGIDGIVVSVVFTYDKHDASSRRVAKLLKEVGPILESIALDQAGIVVDDVPTEKTWTEQGKPPYALHPLNAKETGRLNDLLTEGRKDVGEITGPATADAETLDAAYKGWREAYGAVYSAEETAELLGVLFGAHLVDKYGFQWVSCSHAGGVEYAVRHDDGTILFPVSVVAKAVAKEATDFFVDLELAVRNKLAEAAGEEEEGATESADPSPAAEPETSVQEQIASATANSTEEWGSYYFAADAGNGSTLVLLNAPAVTDVRAHPVLLQIEFILLDPRADGLPSKKEMSVLNDIKDRLKAAVEGPAAGRFVGRRLMEGRCLLAFYLREESMPDGPATVFKRFPQYRFQTGLEYDSEWEFYADELMPTPEERQVMENSWVLRNLEEDGDDHSIVRPVDHWLYFPSSTEREFAWNRIKKENFECADKWKDEESELSYGLKVTADQSVEPAAINEAVLILFRIAEQYNGEYDGWESPVMRPRLTEP